MPEFDEETKKLIAGLFVFYQKFFLIFNSFLFLDADQARKEYDDQKRKVNDIEDEIK